MKSFSELSIYNTLADTPDPKRRDFKLVIAGGRSYQFTDIDKRSLDTIHLMLNVTEVVSGGAPGADKCGEEWAEFHGIKVTKFEADWAEHGKSAGPKRNAQMAEYCDAVALFPGGKGTSSMMNEAKKAKKEIFDYTHE
jgi:hypothetical protein